MATRRFELREGTSSKYWEIAVESVSVTVRFGRIASAGQTKTKDHPSAAVAANEAAKLVKEKTSKGYREVAVEPAGELDRTSPAQATSGALSDVLAELEHWLSVHRVDVLATLLPPATDADLERLLDGLRENGLPVTCTLPDELVTLAKWHAGQSTLGYGDADGFFLGRNLMQTDWMIESHQIMVGHGHDNDEDPAHYHPGWIGVMDNGYSILCVDAFGTFGHAPGHVVYVDFKGGESRTLVVPSLTAWFRYLLALTRHPIGARSLVARSGDEDHDDLVEEFLGIQDELVPRLFPGYPIEHTIHDVADAAAEKRRKKAQLLFLKLEKREGRKTFRWECDVDGKSVDERVIEIGVRAEIKNVKCDSGSDARDLAERLRQERLATGFREIE